MRSRHRCFSAAVLLVAIVGLADADESDDRIAGALKITTDAARRYEFNLAGPQPSKLVLHGESILRWSNPVAGEVYGNVFIWTHEGRPEVIGSILQWYSPHTHGSHEFHSLALRPITGSRNGTSVWTSKQAGVELQPLGDQQSVAASQLVRTRQLRAISRKFSVRKTDREGVSRELRLLSQPVYRYGSSDSDVLDGAVFSFVQGTDPEALLMIEARKAGDQWQWQYAMARMNSVKFVAKYQEQEVWRVEGWPWSKVKNGREPYTHFGPFDRDGVKR